VLLLLLPLLALAEDNLELRALQEADQADRTGTRSSEEWREVLARDKRRRERVLELMKSGELNTARDYFNAALIMQHGSTTEDIRIAHALSTIASTLDPAYPRAKWLMAASWDRLMMRLKQPQWYGTQSVRDPSGKFVLYPVLANAVTDEERAKFGVLTLEEAQSRAESRDAGE